MTAAEKMSAARAQGFLETKRPAPESAEAWWDECKRQRTPCVCVAGGKTTRFWLDMETTPHDLSFAAWVELDLLVRRYMVGTATVSPDGAYFRADTEGHGEIVEHLRRLASDSIIDCETGVTLCIRHAEEAS